IGYNYKYYFCYRPVNSIDIMTNNIMMVSTANDALQQSYNSLNLGILFLVMCGILLPTGVIGFMKSKNVILKIPLIISLIGSFTWIIYQIGRASCRERV